MSGGLEVLKLKEEDVRKFLITGAHLGSKHKKADMSQYIFRKRRSDGCHIINLRWTWEKLLLAARAIVSMKNPDDVVAVAIHPSGTRAVIKFQLQTGCQAIAGHFVPGTFTNQGQKHFLEPRLLIVSDPVCDHQAIVEASKCNLPVIAFCNTDASLELVDIAIPCNTRGYQSIGLMWWMLAREILAIRGSISRDIPWNIAVDLFINRTPEEEKAEMEKQKMLAKGERTDLGDDARGQSQFPGTANAPEDGFVNAGDEWNPGVESQLSWPAETQQAEWGARQQEIEWGAEPPQTDWEAEPQQTAWRDENPQVEWGDEPQQAWGSNPKESTWNRRTQGEDMVTDDWN